MRILCDTQTTKKNCFPSIIVHVDFERCTRPIFIHELMDRMSMRTYTSASDVMYMLIFFVFVFFSSPLLYLWNVRCETNKNVVLYKFTEFHIVEVPFANHTHNARRKYCVLETELLFKMIFIEFFFGTPQPHTAP